MTRPWNRLLVRIWLHGILLFCCIVAVIFVARFVLPRQDALFSIRAHPVLAIGLADRVLTQLPDREAARREAVAVAAETSIGLAVYGADGGLLVTSGPVEESPLAPATAAERAEVGATRITESAAPSEHGRDRWIVAAADRRAYAVLGIPKAPSLALHAIALGLAAIVLAFLFVALPIATTIVRPLARLGAFAKELGAGNLAARVEVRRPDELGELARSLNAMAGQLQQLRSTERELLAGVSHELRTPLARMRVVLELATVAELAQARGYLNEITTDLSEVEQMLDAIIVASRLDPEASWTEAQPPVTRVAIEAGELVTTAATRFRSRWPGRALADPAPGERAVLDGDPVLLRRALDNLLDNARKYSADDQPIEIATAVTADAVRFEVADHGIGIAPEDRERVFTPFFRADRSRTRATGGVGLGLALVRRIALAHGGEVGFTSELDRGSRFWFSVPRPTPASRDS